MTQEEPPTQLELRALNAALQGGEPWKAVLRRQISALRVIRRDYNDAGGVTEFTITDAVPKAEIPSGAPEYPPLITVRHGALPQGGDFIVWIKDGLIEALEGVAHGDGRWPLDATDFEFP